jgi:hypothetical protein
MKFGNAILHWNSWSKSIPIKFQIQGFVLPIQAEEHGDMDPPSFGVSCSMIQWLNWRWTAEHVGPD